MGIMIDEGKGANGGRRTSASHLVPGAFESLLIFPEKIPLADGLCEAAVSRPPIHPTKVLLSFTATTTHL